MMHLHGILGRNRPRMGTTCTAKFSATPLGGLGEPQEVGVKVRPCCDDGDCLRAEFSRVFDPESPLTDRVHNAGCAVAQTCGSLNAQELEMCFSRLFEIPPECSLREAFIVAYQTERDALLGEADLKKRRAAVDAESSG